MRSESRAIARDVLREIASNVAMAVPRVRQWRLNRGPRAGARYTGEQDILERYAFQALRGVEAYAGPVTGRSIVEFGPGDNLSAGLAMLAAGARRYVTVDRFVPDYSRPSAKEWYAGVAAAWARTFPERAWPEDLDPDRFPEDYPERVASLRGAVEEVSATERFDVVSSWQVGEHVVDVRAFAELTARLLRPNGIAIHRVDFGPHDRWRAYADPLTFLRLPLPIWTAMGSNRGLPNRARHHEFMNAWASAGLCVTCEELHRFDQTTIDFDKLRPSQARAPLDSLLVRDVVYVCRPSCPPTA